MQLDAAGEPILGSDGQPIRADMHVARYGRAALKRLRDAADGYLESLRGGDAPTPDQLEFQQVYGSILDYERRVQFRWKPPRFPLGCRELGSD